MIAACGILLAVVLVSALMTTFLQKPNLDALADNAATAAPEVRFSKEINHVFRHERHARNVQPVHLRRRLGARLPATALVDQFYADVQALGGGRLDTSSLIKRLR